MSGETRAADGLHVAIGLPGAVMLVIGGIVGVGIFVNPAVVARSLSSPALVLAAWVLGGAIALLGAFVYAELAARNPATGGEYAYLRASFGPAAGFLFGWTTLLVVHAGGMAAVAIVFARNLHIAVGPGLPALRVGGFEVEEPAVVCGVLALLAAINCAGVRVGNVAQALMGALKLGAIAAIIVAGLWIAPPAPAAAVAAGQAAPWHGGAGAFGAAMIPVVFSYGGWQTANYVAGEMKQAGRNLARALLIGVVAVIALYLAVNLACLRTLGPALGATLTPAADVLQRAAGAGGARLAAAGIAISAFAYLSQGMLTGPRVVFSMARDGLFFRGAARLGSTSVPSAAILLLAGWTCLLALSGSYEQILSYVISMNFLFFGLSACCLFVLRRHNPAHAGYRAPLHPWSTGAFVAACAAIVACSLWSYPLNSLAGFAILLLGVPPYLFWRRQAEATARTQSMAP